MEIISHTTSLSPLLSGVLASSLGWASSLPFDLFIMWCGLQAPINGTFQGVGYFSLHLHHLSLYFSICLYLGNLGEIIGLDDFPLYDLFVKIID